MSIVTLEHLRRRMEREFFTRALADLAVAERLLTAPPEPQAQLHEWAGLPAACSELRRGVFSARRLALALRRDRAGLTRRLAAFVADSGTDEAWVRAAAERLARPLALEAATGYGHRDPAHA